MKKCKRLERKLKEIQYLLVYAKVDLEYGMGFSQNPFLLACKKDIGKAMDMAVMED